ncbi:MAG: hypothetical protein LBI99_00600 [Propionibacteriaceae bacterium]|jgi:hypothetical protein|nr:hypothetical protein [Propionibacteriaceae bacterium]
MYLVTAEPVGRYWHVEVPALERVTQARNAREVPEMAKDLIEIMTGEQDAAIKVEYVVPAEVAEHLRNAAEARARESFARETAAKELRAAARALRAERLSLADVGAVLGVSHQRAHQLVNT